MTFLQHLGNTLKKVLHIGIEVATDGPAEIVATRRFAASSGAGMGAEEQYQLACGRDSKNGLPL